MIRSPLLEPMSAMRTLAPATGYDVLDVLIGVAPAMAFDGHVFLLSLCFILAHGCHSTLL